MVLDIIAWVKLAIDPLKKIWKFCLLKNYQRTSAKPPLSEKDAKEIAYATLTGQIEKVISYRNIGSKKNYIVVFYKPNKEVFSTRVVILEQVGESYRILWKTDYHTFRVEIEVEDIDNDGIQEIIIQTSDGGTGATTSYLTVYSQHFNTSYTISETRIFSNLAGPVIPQISFNPEPPIDFKKALEHCAIKRGFLKYSPKVDWNDNKLAIPRWHRDNGSNPTGIIDVVLYDGHPTFSSSVIASLDDGKIIWTSYFKNPLVGYIKDSDKWFIAYSPADFYEWACSLANDGKRLWFGVHTLEAIYSFQFNTMQLYRHNSIKGLKFGWDSIVSYKNGKLYVNDSVAFTQDELDGTIDKVEKSRSPF